MNQLIISALQCCNLRVLYNVIFFFISMERSSQISFFTNVACRSVSNLLFQNVLHDQSAFTLIDDWFAHYIFEIFVCKNTVILTLLLLAMLPLLFKLEPPRIFTQYFMSKSALKQCKQNRPALKPSHQFHFIVTY